MNIITTKKQLQELVEFYSKVDAFAFDVESVGSNRLQPVVNDVLWISLATDNRTDVIPLGHPNGEFLNWNKELLLSGQRKIDSGKELKEADYSKNESKWTPIFDAPPEQLLPGDVFKELKSIVSAQLLELLLAEDFDAWKLVFVLPYAVLSVGVSLAD